MKKVLLLILCFPMLLVAQKPAQTSKSMNLTITKNLKLDYLLYLPKGYEKSDKEFPLTIFLHGAGERGTDINQIKKWGIPKLIEQGKEFPSIVVSPQCPKGIYWSEFVMLEKLDHLITKIEKEYRVDRNRIYITGLSMGGYGSWAMAIYQPNRFAAVAPICGDGDVSKMRFIKHIPIWTFHGADDKVVPISGTKLMVNKLQELGANVKFTIYPGVGHNSWTATYANEELYQWLFTKKLSKF